jgi:hypothetical protein
MNSVFSRRTLLAAGSVGLGEILLGRSAVAGVGSFAFREVGTTGLELSENGRPIFVYNQGMLLAPGFPETMRRSSYLHPVHAPNGVVLTDDFNADHPHHRGISWMWPDVVVDGKHGDIWTLHNFQQRFIRWKARETNAARARLAIENGWFDGDRQFLRENVEIVAHPVVDGCRALDFTFELEAIDRPVSIAGTLEGKKGFGGFCFRFAPRDGGAAKTVINTDTGIAKKDAVLAPHRWAELRGTFQGKTAGGRVDDDSSNPGFPTNGWLLRHGFGFLNVSYPGLKPVAIEPDRPLRLTYRVVLF